MLGLAALTVGVSVLGASALGSSGCGRVSYARDAAPERDARADLDARTLDDGGLDARFSHDAGLDGGSVDAGVDAGADVGADATTDDASPGDAPTMRDLVCGASSTITCLTFDVDPPTPWERWDTIDALSTQARVVDPSFRGSALELAIAANPTSSGTGLRTPIDGATFRSGLYVSMWVRVSRPTVSGFLVLVEANNAMGGADQRKVSLDANGTGVHQLVVVGGASVGGVAFPLDRWVCARLSIVDGLVESEVDGELLSSPVPFDVGMFVGLNFGAYSQRDAAMIAFDDVVVSTSPVDCLPP